MKKGEYYYGIVFDKDSFRFEYYFGTWEDSEYEKKLKEMGLVYKLGANSDTLAISKCNMLNKAIDGVINF